MKWMYFVAGAVSVAIIIVMTAYIKPSKAFHQQAPDLETTDYVQRVKAPKLPQQLNFAGESVPLSDAHVRENLDREMLANCFRHSYTFLLIKRSNKFFPII